MQRKVAVERTLSKVEALDGYRLLRRVPMIIHATDGLLETAIRHGIRYHRPVYASLYLVLADSLGGPLDHLALWVTDVF